MKFRFFNNPAQIGGTQLMLQHKDTKIFLDFGKNFILENKYFDFPILQPFFINDLQKIEALPDIDGLYRNSSQKSPLDAVLISHPHLDHYGYLSMLNKTKVMLGEGSKAVIDIRNATYQQTWNKKFDHLEFETFHSGEQIELKDIIIRPIHVDHSIPAAYAFILYCGSRTIVYTGDLRMHGYRTDLTKDFLRQVEKESTAIMFCEGTNLGQNEEYSASLSSIKKHCKTEPDVRKAMTDTIKSNESLTIVETSPADVDRIRTVWQSASDASRQFVITPKQAHLVFQLSKYINNLPRPKDCFLYLNRVRKRGTDEEAYDSNRYTYQQELISKTEPKIIHGEHGRKQLLNSNSVICTDNATMRFLELKQKQMPPINFILSKSEPFCEEMAFSFDKLVNWLKLCKIQRYYQMHVSGHADEKDLRHIIQTANPSALVPMHTEHPELFRHLYDNVHIAKQGVWIGT
jgi:ribonuclease J